MNYSGYLRKRFPLYIISGIVFGLALFALITVGRYRAHITDVLSDMETIVLNRGKIEREVRRIDELDRYFKREFHLDLNNVNMDKHMFRAVDRVHGRFRNAVVNINRSEIAGSMQELPVSIVTPVRSYAMILDHIGYLESFVLPDFEIRNMSVRRGQAGEVSLSVNGALVMPSFRPGGQT